MLWSATNDYGCGAIPNKYIIITNIITLEVMALLMNITDTDLSCINYTLTNILSRCYKQ